MTTAIESQALDLLKSLSLQLRAGKAAGERLHCMLLRPHLYGREPIAATWERACMALVSPEDFARARRVFNRLGVSHLSHAARMRVALPQAACIASNLPAAYAHVHVRLAETECTAALLAAIEHELVVRGVAVPPDARVDDLAWSLHDAIDLDIGMALSHPDAACKQRMRFFGTHHLATREAPAPSSPAEGEAFIQLPEVVARTFKGHCPAIRYQNGESIRAGFGESAEAPLVITTYDNFIAAAQEACARLADWDGRRRVPPADDVRTWHRLFGASAAPLDEAGRLAVAEAGDFTLFGVGEHLELWPGTRSLGNPLPLAEQEGADGGLAGGA